MNFGSFTIYIKLNIMKSKQRNLTEEELYIINEFKKVILSQAIEDEDYITAAQIRDSKKDKIRK